VTVSELHAVDRDTDPRGVAFDHVKQRTTSSGNSVGIIHSSASVPGGMGRFGKLMTVMANLSYRDRDTESTRPVGHILGTGSGQIVTNSL
jgi:hypothetical protein